MQIVESQRIGRKTLHGTSSGPLELAQGIANAANNILNQAPKGKAFTLSAELFLMQHTCHWFCRSKTVASARMMMRHKTSYAQLLQAVAPETRHAYGSLLAG